MDSRNNIPISVCASRIMQKELYVSGTLENKDNNKIKLPIMINTMSVLVLAALHG